MINIFKHWFSHSKEQDIDDCQNPWAGLASYEDPETAERKLKFCGRDDDSYDFARLIMGNVFVTLYGKSGIGKTSLLNAGVFPELREEQYTPVSIRLGMRDDEHPQTYQTMIVEIVERVVKRTETVNVIDEQQDQQAIDYLWNYFARHRFYDKYDESTIPVIVFDQFEEVFRGHRDEAESLLRQLDYLNDKDHTLDSCKIDGQLYRYEQNFRFVVSIREDDLYRLEDSIDNCYLHALKRCRYRLRSLSEEGARDVILIPGKGFFLPDEEDHIVQTITSIARNKEEESVSTNLLSLVCSRIFVDFRKSGANHITPALVDLFVKGNPFEKFYDEATRGFSNKEKSYIENHLVDCTGRRNSVPETDFLLHVNNGTKLLEGNARILQRISTSSDGGSYRIELIHDSFCEPLSVQKEIREKRKRKLWLAMVSSIAIFSVLAVIYVWNINHKMRKNESRILAEKASALVDEGDSYLARLLLLEALPPNRPYTIEAESALRKAVRSGNTILRGHTEDVNSASFSPNGKYIVSASADKTIRIWDAATGRQLGLPFKGHTGSVNSVSFSPDGKYIVSASADKTIRIWDAATGKQLGLPFKGHTGSVNSVSFSSDGKYIVSASADKTIRIWDSMTGRQMGSPFVGHTDCVFSAAFSPDGKIIVSASADKTIRIWDALTGRQMGAPLEGHTDWVRSVSFSSDGNYIVSASWDKTVRIWKTATRRQMGSPLVGHTSYVHSASFSPDCKYIVSTSADKTVRIWDVETGRQVGTPLEGHMHWGYSVSFSPDGKYIVSASWDKTIRIWDIAMGIQVGTPLEEHTDHAFSAFFSPDGKKLVSASADKTVCIWDAATGRQVAEPLNGHTDEVYSAFFSPNGKYIVSASADKTIRIWDAATGRQLGLPFKGHTGSVNSASYSPDGKCIVSASTDKTIRIWDAATGRQLDLPFKGHTGSVNSAFFSPDGKFIVSASADKTIRIWDALTGQQVGKALEGHTDIVYSASFSPDCKNIVSASADKTIRIWDAVAGRQVGEVLEGHTDEVYSASFSPDGKYIVSASADKTIRIWDAVAGRQVGSPLVGHTDEVNYASFSPDCKYIVSASSDNTVRVWNFLPLQQLIDETRERFKNRQLTPEERRKYYLE